MTRIALVVLAALVLVPAVAACGSGDDGDQGAGGGGGDASTVEIVGTEFALDPARVEVDAPGTYTFVFRNEGGTVHALEVDGHGVEEETEEIGAGETAELTVELAEAGEYELYCPVGNHRDQGMEGTLVVGAAGTTTHETTTGDDDDSGGSGDDDSDYRY
ncbi:MAG TPA: cupredoxin domain-containing protein [Gaiellaceae bacterium]|nr:cupredoxin domain-containing protein [Gaiellaceae bacterium]